MEIVMKNRWVSWKALRLEQETERPEELGQVAGKAIIATGAKERQQLYGKRAN
jgi:hypothetical protein